MDRRTNPFTPAAGRRPPELAGRDAELDDFGLLLDRLGDGYWERSMFVSGQRGVGKTVLLREFDQIAVSKGWVVLRREVVDPDGFALMMARQAERALLELSPPERWRDRAKRAAATISSFELSLGLDGSPRFGIDVDPSPAAARSGRLDEDLADVFVALGHAAIEEETGVVFLLDELQLLPTLPMSALIAAVHAASQEEVPVTVVGAGLPHLPELAVDARSYSNRLFAFPVLGHLEPDEAARALTEPLRAEDVEMTDEAVHAVLSFTEGYPYFLQEFGRAVWIAAESSPIDIDDVAAARPAVIANLRRDFFTGHLERTTPMERAYLHAMAKVGGGDPMTSGAVATAMGHTSSAKVGYLRSSLIDKGIVYPPDYGSVRFTVPQFDRYLRGRVAEDAADVAGEPGRIIAALG